jgi:hypothetical protein
LREHSHLCNLNELGDGVLVGDRLGFGLGHAKRVMLAGGVKVAPV